MAVSRTRTSGDWPGTCGMNGVGQLLTRRLYPGGPDAGADGLSERRPLSPAAVRAVATARRASRGSAGGGSADSQQPLDPCRRAQRRPRSGSSAVEPVPGPRACAARRSSRSRRATSPAGSVSPAQPQSTVRSLGSGEKLTPWSMAHSRPDVSRRQCEPLRSELLIAASSTARDRTSSRVGVHDGHGATGRRLAVEHLAPPGRRAPLRHEVDDDGRRPAGRTGRRSTAGPTRARADRRAARSAARGASHRARTPPRRPPPGRRGCRRGSPTAAAPPRTGL